MRRGSRRVDIGDDGLSIDFRYSDRITCNDGRFSWDLVLETPRVCWLWTRRNAGISVDYERDRASVTNGDSAARETVAGLLSCALKTKIHGE